MNRVRGHSLMLLLTVHRTGSGWKLYAIFDRSIVCVHLSLEMPENGN